MAIEIVNRALSKKLYDRLDAEIRDRAPFLAFVKSDLKDLMKINSKDFVNRLSKTGSFYGDKLINSTENDRIVKSMLRSIIVSALNSVSASAEDLAFGIPFSGKLENSILDIRYEDNNVFSVVFIIRLNVYDKQLAIATSVNEGIVEEFRIDALASAIVNSTKSDDVETIASAVAQRYGLTRDEVIDMASSYYDSFGLSDDSKYEKFTAEIGLMSALQDTGGKLHDLSDHFGEGHFILETEFEIDLSGSNDDSNADKTDEYGDQVDMSNISVEKSGRYRVQFKRQGSKFSFSTMNLNEAIIVRNRVVEFYNQTRRLPSGAEELGL